MDSKEVVITGATRGIGFYTAQFLTRRGFSVSLIARNQTRLAQAKNALLNESDNKTKVRTYQADLSLISETKRVAAQLREELPRVDILINNAGALFTQRAVTREGHEKTWSLNHYAYFVMTLELLPMLRLSSTPRIVSVASDAHQRGHIHWNDINLERGYRFGGWSAYCQSKLANILFTRELSKRLGAEQIARSTLHPGFVASHFGRDERSWMRAFMALSRPLQRSVARGAETLIWAATSDQAADLCGDYLKDRRIRTPSRRAQSFEDARRLWDYSLDACGYSASPL